MNLYVDLHGGFRDTATVLNAILMLIKDISNIELKDVYSIEYPDSIGTIKSVKKNCKYLRFCRWYARIFVFWSFKWINKIC